jgi:hypothetical protein
MSRCSNTMRRMAGLVQTEATAEVSGAADGAEGLDRRA